jgi:hypothetical protein
MLSKKYIPVQQALVFPHLDAFSTVAPTREGDIQVKVPRMTPSGAKADYRIAAFARNFPLEQSNGTLFITPPQIRYRSQFAASSRPMA